LQLHLPAATGMSLEGDVVGGWSTTY